LDPLDVLRRDDCDARAGEEQGGERQGLRRRRAPRPHWPPGRLPPPPLSGRRQLLRRNAESGGSGRQLAGFLAGREKSENRLGARGRGQSEYGRGDAGGRARCRRRWWPGGCHLPCQVPVPCVCFQDDFFSFPRTPTRNIPALRQWLRPGNNK
jgi:hypothetical protein